MKTLSELQALRPGEIIRGTPPILDDAITNALADCGLEPEINVEVTRYVQAHVRDFLRQMLSVAYMRAEKGESCISVLDRFCLRLDINVPKRNGGNGHEG